MLKSWLAKLSVVAMVEPIRTYIIGRIWIDLAVEFMIIICSIKAVYGRSE